MRAGALTHTWVYLDLGQQRYAGHGNDLFPLLGLASFLFLEAWVAYPPPEQQLFLDRDQVTCRHVT
jgi:hypothetical protein